MSGEISFFASELSRYYEQRGKTVSSEVLSVLDKCVSELTPDELVTYEKLVLPGRNAVSDALRYQLERRGTDREEWREQLRRHGQSIIGQIVAELLSETGTPAAPSAAPQGTNETSEHTRPGAYPLEPPAAGHAAAPASPGFEIAGLRDAEASQPASPANKSTPDSSPTPPPGPGRKPGGNGEIPEGESTSQSGKTAGKRALNILFWAFFALVSVLLVLLVLSLFNLGVRAFAVSSGSMSPAIETGSLVFVRSSEEYRVGDVITFNLVENVYTTHRIHEIREENGITIYVTKGDANEGVDSDPVHFEQIEGRVVFSLPLLGYAVAFLRTLPGFILIMSAFGILIASLLCDIVEDVLVHYKKRSEEAGRN